MEPRALHILSTLPPSSGYIIITTLHCRKLRLKERAQDLNSEALGPNSSSPLSSYPALKEVFSLQGF
jgi:hypothetical protein